MSENNEKKTKAQILAEIEALQRELAASENAADAAEPSYSRPVTRREALTSWIAPVILSVPVVGAIRAGSAEAQVVPTFQPVNPPTFQPVVSPTFQPVVVPTFQPVVSPTFQPVVVPTFQPVVSPTFQPVVVPTFQPVAPPTAAPPTAAPTLAPTFGPAQPVPGPGIAGIAVLGAALAVAGAKLLKDPPAATGEEPPADGSKTE